MLLIFSFITLWIVAIGYIIVKAVKENRKNEETIVSN